MFDEMLENTAGMFADVFGERIELLPTSGIARSVKAIRVNDVESVMPGTERASGRSVAWEIPNHPTNGITRAELEAGVDVRYRERIHAVVEWVELDASMFAIEIRQ